MIARSIRGSFHPVTVYSAKANSRFFLTAQTPREGGSGATRILMNDPVSRDLSAPRARAEGAEEGHARDRHRPAVSTSSRIWNSAIRAWPRRSSSPRA